METTFEKLSRGNQEKILMPELINLLRKLGGYATRNELIKEMRTTGDVVPEDFIDFVKISKNGREYRPFKFVFNFSISNLELAGFVTVPKKGSVQLTEKGRSFDLANIDTEKDIMALANPEWIKRSKKKRATSEKQLDELEEVEAVGDTEKESWRIMLDNVLKSMSPQKFEIFSRRLVKEMGVDIDETIGIALTGDGGLDGFGYITADDFRTTRVAIQAKRWNGKVSSPEIDKFRGAMDKHNAEFGIFITTSDYTREAINASRIGTRVITLINGEDIADLVAKFELYVTPVTTYVLDDFYKSND